MLHPATQMPRTRLSAGGDLHLGASGPNGTENLYLEGTGRVFNYQHLGCMPHLAHRHRPGGVFNIYNVANKGLHGIGHQHIAINWLLCLCSSSVPLARPSLYHGWSPRRAIGPIRAIADSFK